MRSQQSKFLASIKSTSDDGSDSSKFDQEVHSDDSGHDSKESGQVICSLCHDPHSKYPLSYLVLLQVSDYRACVPALSISVFDSKHGIYVERK